MKILNREVIQKVKRIGEVFDIDQVSFQLKELLTLISEGKEIRREGFIQISPEALSFLQKKAQFLEENELRYILLALLTEPKPEKQRNIIKIFDEFLAENKEKTEEKINREKTEIQKFIYINEVLERSVRGDWCRYLLYFYYNPENQEIRPRILNETLERAIKLNWLYNLLYFYSNPENQKIRPELLSKALEEAVKRKWWEYLLSFYSNPENQKIRPEIFNEALEGAKKEGLWGALLSFYTNPENQKIMP